MIGIVGGIGPLAGLDLVKKIIENTNAKEDKEHLPVVLASLPGPIGDRTNYLKTKKPPNPGVAIAKVIMDLKDFGATTIGIACNTAHAGEIFDETLRLLSESNCKVEIVNMIEETISYVRASRTNNVGIMCTDGSYSVGLYQKELSMVGITPVMLDEKRHSELINVAIYNEQYGLKAKTEPDPTSIKDLNLAIEELEMAGAKSILLGCTEIGMIEHRLIFGDLKAFNPNTILARALIRKVAPDRLRSEHV